MDLHGSSQFSKILNGFLQSLTQCRSAAEGLSEPLVYTPRPEIIGLNPSLSRVDEAQSKTFFILFHLANSYDSSMQALLPFVILIIPPTTFSQASL